MESQKQERGLKRVSKIIALASIFSVILTYSSLTSSLQEKLQLLSIYSNLVDKKYMFLLCNGIVCFVMGNFRDNFETLLHGKATNIAEETKEVGIKDMRESKVKKAVALLEEKSDSKEEEEEEEEEVTLVVKDDDGKLAQDLAIIKTDEINDSLLSSEELNKKCEDFIRKMKAEIRLESRKLITF